MEKGGGALDLREGRNQGKVKKGPQTTGQTTQSQRGGVRCHTGCQLEHTHERPGASLC